MPVNMSHAFNGIIYRLKHNSKETKTYVRELGQPQRVFSQNARLELHFIDCRNGATFWPEGHSN